MFDREPRIQRRIEEPADACGGNGADYAGELRLGRGVDGSQAREAPCQAHQLRRFHASKAAQMVDALPGEASDRSVVEWQLKLVWTGSHDAILANRCSPCEVRRHIPPWRVVPCMRCRSTSTGAMTATRFSSCCAPWRSGS